MTLATTCNLQLKADTVSIRYMLSCDWCDVASPRYSLVYRCIVKLFAPKVHDACA